MMAADPSEEPTVAQCRVLGERVERLSPAALAVVASIVGAPSASHFQAAAARLTEAAEGLSALEVGGLHLQQLEDIKGVLELNESCLADPAAAAQLQRKLRQERLRVEASLPSVAATVVGVQSRPELNGAEVTIRRFLTDKGRYTAQLPPTADGKQEKINLKPANLVLAEGSAVVATGLTGAPELNGQKGVVEGWLEEKRRYAVRLEDTARKKAANIKPENCRADVLAL